MFIVLKKICNFMATFLFRPAGGGAEKEKRMRRRRRVGIGLSFSGS
jgi:hypothetical protein